MAFNRQRVHSKRLYHLYYWSTKERETIGYLKVQQMAGHRASTGKALEEKPGMGINWLKTTRFWWRGIKF